jgi:glycosyltransferase involved in cell wall biosynthesis
MPSRPLRVLTLVDVLVSDGGAERVATRLAAALDRARFESSICATRPRVHEHVVAELRAAGVGIDVLPRRGKLDVLAWRRLVSILRRRRIDVLHAHKFGSNVWAAALGHAAGVPVVICHEHTWSYVGQPVRRFLDRELIGRRADAFVAVSPEDARRMVEVEGVRREKIRLILNGVADHTPTGADVRRELGIAPDAPVIGAVGALRPQKAYDFLFEVAADLRVEFPGLRVLVVGDWKPDWLPAHEAKIRELGLEETVTLLGRRTDVPDVLEAVDVAVLSSDFEGLPLSLMEYMAAARPIVATRVGGVPTLVEDGVHGLLVEPRDRAAMAGAITSLLRDRERASALGQNAAERRRSEFSFDAMTRDVEDLYEELYARSARARGEGWSAPPR